MSTPIRHAICSPSSSERWLNCTAAPRFEEGFSESVSVYAEEGRLAHSICELYANNRLGLGLSTRKRNSEVKKLQADPLYNPEMLTTAQFYADYLWGKSLNGFDGARPYAVTEQEVDLSKYIPGGFGSCDCIMIGGRVLHITDYKHGKGVQVNAHGNTQMRLYALGALERYGAFYDIQTVTMAIVQPRVSEEVSEDSISVGELRAWGENTVRPAAEAAYNGSGEFHAGEWCRFCRGRQQCRARAEYFTALQAHKDRIPGRQTDRNAENTLTDEEIGRLLTVGAELSAWYDDLKAYARETILQGGNIPGWKVVAGVSRRAFTDTDAALKILEGAGYTDLYKTEPRSLAELEKQVGRKKFKDLLGEYIRTPPGKATLAAEDDKREAITSAAADFTGITGA